MLTCQDRFEGVSALVDRARQSPRRRRRRRQSGRAAGARGRRRGLRRAGSQTRLTTSTRFWHINMETERP